MPVSSECITQPIPSDIPTGGGGIDAPYIPAGPFNGKTHMTKIPKALEESPESRLQVLPEG